MTTATLIQQVELDRIRPNPWQPRAGIDPDYLVDLQQSILAVGLLQEPLGRELEDGTVQLAFGHTRVEAIRGLAAEGKWAPVVDMKLSPLTDEDMAYIALEENRKRKNLTPMEEISAWGKVINDIPGVTIQSLADRIGINRTTMSRNLAILDLPRSVLDLVNDGSMSLKAAQEFLCLRNDDHCHEDFIDLVLKDLGGQGASLSYTENKPPDYRFKTVRESILAVVQGRHAYTWINTEEESRNWRPLFDRKDGRGGRDISFDAAAFREAHAFQVHHLPQGDESGAADWTCLAREWGRWSSRATREQTKAPEDGKGSPTQSTQPRNGHANRVDDWWKVVKKDPMVKTVVGSRLRSANSPEDLTEEDREALGTRVVYHPPNNITDLPQEAQPDGIVLDRGYAARPPMFDFSVCASCTEGATWETYDGKRGRLGCVNAKAYRDKASVGMQHWVEWRDVMVGMDHEDDSGAIHRLSCLGREEARGVVLALRTWLEEGAEVRPLGATQEADRTKYNYWPAGAEYFAALIGVKLFDAARNNWGDRNRWGRSHAILDRGSP